MLVLPLAESCSQALGHGRSHDRSARAASIEFLYTTGMVVVLRERKPRSWKPGKTYSIVRACQDGACRRLSLKTVFQRAHFDRATHGIVGMRIALQIALAFVQAGY